MCRLLNSFILGLVLLEMLTGSTARTTEWPEITSTEITTKKSTTTSTTVEPTTTPTSATTPTTLTTPTTPTPTTPPPTTPPPTPTQPQCPKIQCLLDSPQVCGRLEGNQCQRFASVCEMMNEIRQSNISVTATRDMYCLGLKDKERGPCYLNCPKNPRRVFPCRPTPSSEEICVRSRDGRRCKMLANRCQLREQNCYSKPRQTWHPTFKRNCGRRLVGDKPGGCLKLPIAPIGGVIN